MNARTFQSIVSEELAAVGRSFPPALARSTRKTLWCLRQPGFGTRCYAGDRKTYIVQARMGGRTRTVTIADARLITEALARDIARRVLVRVQVGENPADTRLKVKEVPTYSAFLQSHLERGAWSAAAAARCQDRAAHSLAGARGALGPVGDAVRSGERPRFL